MQNISFKVIFKGMHGSHQLVTVVYVHRNILFIADDDLAKFKYAMVKMFLSPIEDDYSRRL